MTRWHEDQVLYRVEIWLADCLFLVEIEPADTYETSL